MSVADADVVIIGGGIVGLATARALVNRGAGDVIVVEKEADVGRHQSGRNSGVIHSGIYYAPGSRKAALALDGRARLFAFCADHAIPVDRCGKVIVATRDAELGALAELERRGRANGVDTERLDPRQLATVEPHARGIAALTVPSTAVTDFRRVSAALADELRAAGVHVRAGTAVSHVETADSRVVVHTSGGPIRARRVANCAGLHSDEVARASGHEPSTRIIAFRGEYHTVVGPSASLVRHLVYPVPDPRFPFLGVHLTRGVDGSVHAGPNAVLAFAREGYRRWDLDGAYLRSLAAAPALRHLARRYCATGTAELTRSLSRRATAQALQRMIPGLDHHDLIPAPGGVRAQAVAPDGTLVDDFAFVSAHRTLHVLNAPSPAATASLAIGESVAAALDAWR